MQVRDALRRTPDAALGDTSVARVAELMDTAAVGAVVVEEDGAPIGIVTDRDLATRVLARGLAPDTPVIDVMSINVVTVDGDADLRAAVALFAQHAVRRLPVVSGGRVIGLLALDDLVIDAVGDLVALVRPVIGEVVSSPVDGGEHGRSREEAADAQARPEP